MFWIRRKRAWYWNAVAILVVLRVIYGFARFFMRVVDKQAGQTWKQKNSSPKPV